VEQKAKWCLTMKRGATLKTMQRTKRIWMTKRGGSYLYEMRLKKNDESKNDDPMGVSIAMGEIASLMEVVAKTTQAFGRLGMFKK